MNNLFLTGKKGIGKSTLLKKAISELNIPIAGYTTERVFEGFYRKYVAKPLYNKDEEYTIVKSDSRDNSKVWFPEVFEEGMVPLLDKSLEYGEIIVMDELGCSENDILKFTSKVFELLDSKKIVFGVLKEDNCQFINSIKNRKDVKLITVTEDNRDYLLGDILNILKTWI